MPPDDSQRIAILNGFGRTIGDSVIGLQALFAALALKAIPPAPVLFRMTSFKPIIAEIYDCAGDLAEVRPMPDAEGESPGGPFAPARKFFKSIDIRDFAFDPAFRGVAMIDFFLKELGLDPQSVPATLKRNSWLEPRVNRRPVPGLPQGYVLVCPGAASPLRDMPEEFHHYILRWLSVHCGRPVVTQGAAQEGAIAVPALAGFTELCGLVASARLVISTDTGMVHLADAFSVPCLAFFTTHRPEWRVRDYPSCRPVHLPAPGIPEALEFGRNEGDLKAMQAAWWRHGLDLSWLDPILVNMLN
jgi:Glycosyltransferase family 9 (heptosyltransferase)